MRTIGRWRRFGRSATLTLGAGRTYEMLDTWLTQCRGWSSSAGCWLRTFKFFCCEPKNSTYFYVPVPAGRFGVRNITVSGGAVVLLAFACVMVVGILWTFKHRDLT
jgi:hypothetical protein